MKASKLGGSRRQGFSVSPSAALLLPARASSCCMVPCTGGSHGDKRSKKYRVWIGVFNIFRRHRITRCIGRSVWWFSLQNSGIGPAVRMWYRRADDASTGTKEAILNAWTREVLLGPQYRTQKHTASKAAGSPYTNMHIFVDTRLFWPLWEIYLGCGLWSLKWHQGQKLGTY